VPKSRGRKTRPRASASRPPGVSGDPQRRAIAGLATAAERAAARMDAAVRGDVSDPLQLTSLPPLFLDLAASGYGDLIPAERCVDDCLILVHAYAQLGIAAQVRTAELAITTASTGQHVSYGTLAPQWEDCMLRGHTIVWIPGLGHLVDPTAEQYPKIAACRGGPVIAAGPATAPNGDEVRRVETRRAGLQLAYTLTPAAATAALLNRPVVQAEGSGHARRGINVASQVVAWLAECQPPERIALIPNRRAAALIEAVRDLPEHPTAAGDRRFVLPGPHGEPVIVRLDEIPLPEGTPPAVKVK
jgi:hypothetical protein